MKGIQTAIRWTNLWVATVASTAIATGVSFASPATAETIQESKSELAQLFTGDRRMMTTYGRGMASATADSAEISLYFNRPETYLDDGSLSPTEPIARAEMQRVVDTLVAAGIPEEAVEIELSGGPYYYGTNRATVVVTIAEPTQGEIERIVQIAEAINFDDGTLFYSDSNDFCSVEDITALENEARVSAIEDARRRIDAMAVALDVMVMDVLAAVEIHSYAPVSTSCYPSQDMESGDEARPEVQLELGVLVTYGIR
ncbi:MAG: SIMPL domain-containing protein [Cyanobacteriota bacterium]|nr:SIMPL domain-containing protein [Cyanobacteriota bacterium]